MTESIAGPVPDMDVVVAVAAAAVGHTMAAAAAATVVGAHCTEAAVGTCPGYTAVAVAAVAADTRAQDCWRAGGTALALPADS